MKVLVVGASGMIGSTVLRVLSEKQDWQVFGSVRSAEAGRFFPQAIAGRLIAGVEATDSDALLSLFNRVRPDVVVNCAGLTKHLPSSDDVLTALPINSLMPHRLAKLSELVGARLIHISTDCVFTGSKGHYLESDPPDAQDVYGRSKIMGEVDYPHAVTLRTSTIGHELNSAYGLLDWFLSQGEQCKGFTKAIFSGLPTVVFAQVIRDVVIPRPDLHGLYHVAAEPIDKYSLLRLIATTYGKMVEIVPDEQLAIDRSLNGDRFRAATGYRALSWPDLINVMHAYH